MRIRLGNKDDMCPTRIVPFGFSNFQHCQLGVELHIEATFPRRARHIQSALPVLEAVLLAWGTLALPRAPKPSTKYWPMAV